MEESVIKKHLKSDCFNFILRSSLPSTNTFLKDNAKLFPEFTTVIAESQSDGRGRLGHSFHSPSDHGIYLSILLRPENYLTDNVLVTCASAVSVCEAIEFVTGKKCEIKWVNDIFLNGKKICGILTEGCFDTSGKLSEIVLGVGINVFPYDFPEEIRNIAASVYRKGETIPNEIREKIIAAFLDRFLFHYRCGITSDGNNSFFEEYKRRSFVIGRQAIAVSGEKERKCRIISLNCDCSLNVIYENGENDVISSGEIRLRPL